MAMVPSRFFSAAARRAAAAIRNTSSMVSWGLLRMMSLRSKQFCRIVDKDFRTNAFVRHPVEHQVEQVGVVRHRLEIIRMRPIRAPKQAIGIALDHRMNE